MWKMHYSAHKTQLHFPSDLIASPQYFSYVCAKRLVYWYIGRSLHEKLDLNRFATEVNMMQI